MRRTLEFFPATPKFIRWLGSLGVPTIKDVRKSRETEEGLFERSVYLDDERIGTLYFSLENGEKIIGYGGSIPLKAVPYGKFQILRVFGQVNLAYDLTNETRLDSQQVPFP